MNINNFEEHKLIDKECFSFLKLSKGRSFRGLTWSSAKLGPKD